MLGAKRGFQYISCQPRDLDKDTYKKNRGNKANE